MPVRGGNRVASRPRFVGHGVLRGGSFLKPQNEPRRLIAQTVASREASGVFPLSPSRLASASWAGPESVHQRSSPERGPHYHEIEVAGVPRGQGGRPGLVVLRRFSVSGGWNRRMAISIGFQWNTVGSPGPGVPDGSCQRPDRDASQRSSERRRSGETCSARQVQWPSMIGLKPALQVFGEKVGYAGGAPPQRVEAAHVLIDNLA